MDYKFNKIANIFVSIVLGYFIGGVLFESDDINTIVLISIFWLLAFIHYHNPN